MKDNTPEIICFDDLVAHYSLAQGSGFLYSGNPGNEPKEMKQYRLDVLESLYKNREALLEIEEKMLSFYQEYIIHNPQVYVARTTDKKNDNEYFTAKTFWPMKNGRRKEVKIYLGKAEEFDNNTLSSRAKEYAKKKMSETLRRRKDMEEI